MAENEDFKYAVKLTADCRVYNDFKEGKAFTFKYPNNCKKCKRHRKALLSKRRSLTMENLVRTKNVKESRYKSKEKKKRKYNKNSPLRWQLSPLLNSEAKLDSPSPSCRSKTDCSNDSDTTITTLQGNPLTGSVKKRRLSSMTTHIHLHSNELISPEKQSIQQHTDTSNLNDATSIECGTSFSSDVQLDDANTPENIMTRCRYCLSNEIDSENRLIAPCRCSGSSKYVHKTCLEKWLTLRNLNECEVCRTRYMTEWVDRPTCTPDFPTMERRDIVLLILTISFYITLVFQFLGVIYVSTTTHVLKFEARIMTLIGLSLGLFWFMIGSITLTVITYTSEYWKKWRYSNKRKIVILEPVSTPDIYRKQFSESKSNIQISGPLNVKANISKDYDLSLAVPV